MDSNEDKIPTAIWVWAILSLGIFGVAMFQNHQRDQAKQAKNAWMEEQAQEMREAFDNLGRAIEQAGTRGR